MYQSLLTRSKILTKQPFLHKNYQFFSKRNLVLGRATSIGTKYFLENSNIQLQHNLQKSNLFINPIVIGNPFTLQNGYDETCDALYYGAVMEDRCNCFYVYSNNEAGVWHSKSMSKLVESGIDREGLVTVANMGNVRNRDDVMKQLENAKKLTDQEFIDIAMLNITPAWKESAPGDFDSVVKLLEELCSTNDLHSYGFSMNIEPFNMHTPAPNRGADHLFFPAQFEHEITSTMPKCDIIAYPLSPTHAVPHALAMLPAAPEDATEEALMYDEYHDRHRKFTRMAVHPFCCYRGHGSPTPPDMEDDVEMKRNSKSKSAISKSAELIKESTQANDTSDPDVPYINGIKEDDPVIFLISGILPDEISDKFGEALDALCPALSSTPKLEDKALRIVLSYGHEIVTIEPEIKPALGKLKLTPDDLVCIDDVAIIFGGFMIPLEIDEALREGVDEEEMMGGSSGMTTEMMNEMQLQAEREAAEEGKKRKQK